MLSTDIQWAEASDAAKQPIGPRLKDAVIWWGENALGQQDYLSLDHTHETDVSRWSISKKDLD